MGVGWCGGNWGTDLFGPISCNGQNNDTTLGFVRKQVGVDGGLVTRDSVIRGKDKQSLQMIQK